MKIRIKIFVELCVGIIIFMLILYFQGWLEKNQLLLLVIEKKQEKQVLFEKISKLRGESLATLSIDYTYWDEMVNFVRFRDSSWAKDNLEPALSTYKADQILIYDKSRQQIYKISTKSKESLEPLSLSPAEIKNIFLKSPFCHFFVNTPLGITEVRGAIIVPSSDNDRKTSPQGYFFAAKVWDSDYLRQLGDLTQSTITLKASEPAQPSPYLSLEQETTAFSKPLKGLNGKPLSYVYVISGSEAIKSFNRQMRQRYALLMVFAVFSALIIFILYFFWVYRPLRLISLALSDESKDYLSRMKRRRDEFGDIAREIGEHKKAQEDLNAAYSKLQETQNQLIQAEKLNAVGQLASVVSHEVKNPLATIMQSVNYLEKNMPEAGMGVLQMIKDNVIRADNIVRTLVDFSRVSKLNIKAQDINRIIEKSLVLIQHDTAIRDIKIAKELGENIPPAMVDENKIEQVFINILLNAVQAMPKGGRLTIRTWSSQKEVKVEIADTGVGIPSENMKKIFDPFFTTKGPRGGTGLGLAVTKNIIDLHKDTIDIKSAVGEGTQVTITLEADKTG